jgi:hypothetical protein
MGRVTPPSRYLDKKLLSIMSGRVNNAIRLSGSRNQLSALNRSGRGPERFRCVFCIPLVKDSILTSGAINDSITRIFIL